MDLNSSIPPLLGAQHGLQLAKWLGFEEIIFIGMDLSYSIQSVIQVDLYYALFPRLLPTHSVRFVGISPARAYV